MQSPLRLLAYALIVLASSAAAYFCVQAAVMLYDIYTIIQWLGKAVE
jgi:prepilin signal peptidase PulO-like enzyme (type II secretory pathway)